MSNIIDRILNEVCLDERIEDGVPNFENPLHMDALWEFMIRKGIPTEIAKEEYNRIMEKGEHPERQAYNKDGLLVTFPTPKHKQEKIAAGTHFDRDPTKPTPNVFDGDEAPTEPAQSDGGAPAQPETPAGQPTAEPAKPDQPAPTPEPPLKPDVPDTPQEKQATAAVIKQIMTSDNSVLEEVSKWMESNAPDHLREMFRK